MGDDAHLKLHLKPDLFNLKFHPLTRSLRSLLVLGKVIEALSEQRGHVPFLESTLTMLLKGALRSSHTHAIINCRLDPAQGEETLQSLRFGERCGMISNDSKRAASSLSSALETLDTAVGRVEAQLSSLSQRGLAHLPAYARVEEALGQLRARRETLAAGSAAKGSGGGPDGGPKVLD
jgi:hypothetical protein